MPAILSVILALRLGSVCFLPTLSEIILAQNSIVEETSHNLDQWKQIHQRVRIWIT